MAKRKKNKADSHIFTSFYEFNKWLHSKDWISANVGSFQANQAQRPMVYGYEVIVPTIR